MAPELDSPKPEKEYNNELSDEQQQALVERLLAERLPKTDSLFAYYEVRYDDPLADVARTIEARTFKRYFKESPEELRELYGPYEKQSIFFLAVDAQTKKPAGALRVIKNGDNGLLTLNDLASPETEEKGVGGVPVDAVKQYHNISDLDGCWDIGTIAALPEYQGNHKVAVMLYRAMYKKAKEQDIQHIVSIIDVHPYDRSMKPLGIPFKPLVGKDEPFRYYGSKLSRAAYGYIPEFYPIMSKYRKSWKGLATTVVAGDALTRLIEGNRDDEIQLLAA